MNFIQAQLKNTFKRLTMWLITGLLKILQKYYFYYIETIAWKILEILKKVKYSFFHIFTWKVKYWFLNLPNSTKTLKELIILILYSLFQTTEAEEIVPSSFYESSIILVPKPKHFKKG